MFGIMAKIQIYKTKSVLLNFIFKAIFSRFCTKVRLVINCRNSKYKKNKNTTTFFPYFSRFLKKKVQIVPVSCWVVFFRIFLMNFSFLFIFSFFCFSPFFPCKLNLRSYLYFWSFSVQIRIIIVINFLDEK